jgi:hypothetical protein
VKKYESFVDKFKSVSVFGLRIVDFDVSKIFELSDRCLSDYYWLDWSGDIKLR